MRQRLAGLVVVALVLLAGLMIGATPADARQEEEEAPTPTLVLVERSPWVSDSEPVTLQVSTTGDLADTTIRVRIHPTLGDAADLARSLDEDVGGITRSVDLGPTVDLPEGEAGARTITLTGEEIRGAGVHPVVIELRSGDGEVLDLVRTPVLHLGDEDEPLDAPRLALFVDVAIDPTVTPEGRRDPTPSELARLGRLGAFLDQLGEADAPVTVLAVPDTLDALLASTDPSATELLDQVLARASADPIGLPYVPLSASALAGADLGAVLVESVATGSAVLADRLGVEPDLSLWTDGDVTPDAGPVLRFAGVETILTSPEPGDELGEDETGEGRLLEPAGPRPVPALVDEGIDALAVDRATTEALTERVDDRPDALAVALADLVLRDDGRASTVAIRLDDVPDGALLPALLPLLTADDAPVELVERPTAPSVRDPDDEDLPDPVTLPTAADDDLVPVAERYRAVEDEIETFDGFVGAESSRTADLAVQLATSVARDLGTDERLALLDAIDAEIRQGFESISLTGQTDLNLTSRRGELPVSIANANDYPVRVLVRLRSDRLGFPDGQEFEITVDPDVTRLDIPVEALATGSVPTFVEVRTPDGTLLLDSRQLNVRSTAVTGVGLALSLGALAVLAIWWVRTWRKGRRPGEVGDTGTS